MDSSYDQSREKSAPRHRYGDAGNENPKAAGGVNAAAADPLGVAIETDRPEPTKGWSKYLTAIASLALFAGAIALFGGILFRWYRAPYPSVGKAAAWAIGMPEAAYNFAAVTPGKLYRSGLPDADLLRYVQRRYGIKYLVSLRGPSQIHQVARNLGIEVTVLNWRRKEPPMDQLRALLDFLNEKNGVLVHCNSGRDRTGFLVAYYRMRQQHWSSERALEEMEAYGHSQSRRTKTGRLLRHWSEELTRQSNTPATYQQARAEAFAQ